MFILLFNFILYINSLKFGDLTKNIIIKNSYSSKTESYSKKSINYNEDDLIEISIYERINPEDNNYFYLPIISSSDIHGHFYPEELEINNITYSRGGLDYLAKYINIIREEFNNNILYLDAGDIFKGGTESTLTNGEIILDYLNLIKLDGATFGNHEFDYDKDFLLEKLKNSKFPYLVANIYGSLNYKKILGENLFRSKIYTFNVSNKEETKIKIAIIGLTMKKVPNTISGKGYEGLMFLDYKYALTEEVNLLRKDKDVNAVILLSHLGLECGKINNLTLNIYKQTDMQDECDKESELYKLLYEIDEGIIDAVVTGHSHKAVHHFVNKIPVISPVNNGLYSNILYLPFNRNKNFRLEKEQIKIEGPLPICEKIFKKNYKCEFIKGSEINEYLPLVEYSFHNVKIEKDPILQIIHDKYDIIYNNYNEKVGTIIGTDETLSIYKNGSFYLGNLIADIQKSVTGADISIESYGNLRAGFNPGKIPLYKIYDLIPFKNRLCTFNMNGNEIRKMVKIIQEGIKKYFIIAGLKQIFSKNKKGEYFLYDIKYFDGKNEYDLISEKEYIITTNSYLILEKGDNFDKVLLYYKPRNLKCDYGLDVEIIEQYLRNQEIIDIRRYMNAKNPNIRFIN